MKDANKNRDPERAKKRAVADARCALRKLGLLESVEDWAKARAAEGLTDENRAGGAALLEVVAEALGLIR